MSTAPQRWIVVGLGNPGQEYLKTRHNIGAMAVDALAKKFNSSFSLHKRVNSVAEFRIQNQDLQAQLLLAKPLSYMNNLGGPVKSLRDFYSVENSRIIALHDELDIDFATMRIKFGGGENGHNGLKSMTGSLGSPDYFRIRLGIGRPQGSGDPADFVLKTFNSEERKELDFFLPKVCDAIELLILEGLEKAQSAFNC